MTRKAKGALGCSMPRLYLAPLEKGQAGSLTFCGVSLCQSQMSQKFRIYQNDSFVTSVKK